MNVEPTSPAGCIVDGTSVTGKFDSEQYSRFRKSDAMSFYVSVERILKNVPAGPIASRFGDLHYGAKFRIRASD